MFYTRHILPGTPITIRSGILFCLFMFAITFQAHAEQIEVRLQNGLSISANFHQGNPAKSALLFLHGFMQTGYSEPMNSLSANLAAKGYTTLLPTMSLRINHRKQSSPCESMHTHTVEQDLSEIDYWFKWLLAKGFNQVILIGFSSTGNFESLLYSERNPHPALKHNILISLNPMLSSHNPPSHSAGQGKAASSTRAKTPQMYTLGYCKRNYVATPASYASFAAFDEKRLLDLIKQSKVPLNLIFGSDDTILPDDWISKIGSLKSGAVITIIPDANHFFDGTTEFDLSDKVETILKQQAAQS